MFCKFCNTFTLGPSSCGETLLFILSGRLWDQILGHAMLFSRETSDTSIWLRYRGGSYRHNGTGGDGVLFFLVLKIRPCCGYSPCLEFDQIRHKQVLSIACENGRNLSDVT